MTKKLSERASLFFSDSVNLLFHRVVMKLWFVSEELMKQRDALIDEIQSVKEEEEQQKETLKQEHQVQLNDLKESLQMQHEENLHRGISFKCRVVLLR